LLEPADSLSQTPEQPEEQAPRKKRKPTGGLECQLGFLLGLAGLAASRLGQLWIVLDVFAHFTLQFAVMTIGFLVGMLMPRGKLLAAFVVMVIGIVGIGAWPHVASRQPVIMGQLQPGEHALKVASFNTLWVNNDAAAVKAEIERLDADIIMLIEMGPGKRSILAQLRDRYPYQFDCFDVDYCNFALLSKLPLADEQSRGTLVGPAYMRVRLGPEAGGLTVFGVHTSRFPHSWVQFLQVNAIAKQVERTPGPRLVMGDFNATPFSRILGVMQDRGNLTRLTNLPTWPSYVGLPQIAIDHIFVSPGIRQIEAEQIGEAAGSDHYPVSLRIAVPAAP
jgi:endonuclease/exonuclease/phosphatase (EEP) superfamily protein YafD